MRSAVRSASVLSARQVREELSFAVTQPILTPERFEALGLPAATGVLLYGKQAAPYSAVVWGWKVILYDRPCRTAAW